MDSYFTIGNNIIEGKKFYLYVVFYKLLHILVMPCMYHYIW